jgi:hypothetical protein
MDGSVDFENDGILYGENSQNKLKSFQRISLALSTVFDDLLESIPG